MEKQPERRSVEATLADTEIPESRFEDIRRAREFLESTTEAPMRNLSEHEPPPQPSDQPACWDLVMDDIRQRDEYGEKKYGVRLQPFNGRNFAVDAYQESLDLVVYLRGMVHELENTVRVSRNDAKELLDFIDNRATMIDPIRGAFDRLKASVGA